MASLEELRNERIKKMNALIEAGHNPYPASVERDVTLAEAVSAFAKLSKRKKPLTIVGRVMSLRGQGGLIFFDLDDGSGLPERGSQSGRLQALLKKDDVGDASFNLFSDTVDIGDFLECSGSLFVTKRGEKTLALKKWRMIVKSLRPLPDKWHGLTDVDERFRKRYIDLLLEGEVKKRLLLRSALIREMRAFLDKRGFLEVETPVLQPMYGGASAKPFTTHHNALDVDLYLRISDELYLKRLLVGGLTNVYEISKDFRNEGIDMTHYPEFTQLEWYEAYSDAKKQMEVVEDFFKGIIKKLFKKTSIEHGGVTIDFAKKFKVISYFDILRRYALIAEPEKATREELALKAEQLGVPVHPSDTSVKIMDNIYKKACRSKIIQPTFIVDYPVDYLPLAKRQEKNKNLVEAFQLIAGGIELVKAFSELNDPIYPRQRFLKQEEAQKGGDVEAQRLDEDFLEALEHGMPPAGGVGIGIDRLTMLLTDTKNIKEIILFPGMRPKDNRD